MNEKRATRYDDGRAEPNDPCDNRSVDFDWPELERRLGEAEVGPGDHQRMGAVLVKVIEWMLGPEPPSYEKLRLMGRRAVELKRRFPSPGERPTHHT